MRLKVWQQQQENYQEDKFNLEGEVLAWMTVGDRFLQDVQRNLVRIGLPITKLEQTPGPAAFIQLINWFVNPRVRSPLDNSMKI